MRSTEDNMDAKYLLVTFTIIVFTSKADELVNPCDHATTCAECLETNGQCYWCADQDYTSKDSRKPRCNLQPNLQGCRDVQIANGKSKILKNVEFDSKVQVTPQKVKVVLRPGQTQSFTLSVKSAPDYPVRLYYLMDMSNSMKDDKEKLMTLGTKIAKEIKNITSDYKLAFGTFVDKTVSPFVQPGTKEKPCPDCAPAFGYHHVFNFNSDASLFEQAVSKQKISGNLDTPEGGFDALMQVAACGEKIGWEPVGQSRRIVVYVTDASPHIAGDGRIGGITEPHDGGCHLRRDARTKYMQYSKLDVMDYPSVSLLKSTLKKNKVVPILAVTHDVKPVYEKIALDWKNIGAGIGLLKRDSSNIVDLIADNYRKISTTIRLNDDSPGNIVVKYKVTGGCPNAKPTVENECTEVGIGQKVDFRVSFTLTSCADKLKDGRTFSITVPGFGDVVIEASLICDCDCMKSAESAALLCNGKGSMKCGICECDGNRFGKNCECDGRAQADSSMCIMPNSTNRMICSGFGSCVCGQCECDEQTAPNKVISGTYCQCNNFGCDRFEGKICGGSERGICKCGQCVCKEAFQGENCGQKNCTLGKKNCLKDGVVCSGNGACDCDQCECKTGCNGAYCEHCVTSGKCGAHEDCVLCEYGVGETDFCDKCAKNNNVTYERLDVANETDVFDPCGDDNLVISENCVVTLDQEKEVRYSIEIDPNGVSKAQIAACIKPIVYEDGDVPIYVIIVSIIGSIVAIALLLLLIWKVIVTIYDRREYAQFERDRMNPKWNTGENPIYKGASSTFQNPMYKSK